MWNGGKREWVKPGEMKSRPQGEKKERQIYAGKKTGRWTAGDEDNMSQTKKRDGV